MQTAPIDEEPSRRWSPGWYPDGSGRTRWWDGDRWTEAVQDQTAAADVAAARVDPWAWRPILAITAATVAILAVLVGGFWLYANHDRTAFIDDPAVADATATACAALLVDVEATASLPSDTQRTGAQVDAVSRFVATLRALGDDTIDSDIPTGQWLDDWEALASAHAQGTPVPTVAPGRSVIDRMDELAIDSSLPMCQVPAVFRTGS